MHIAFCQNQKHIIKCINDQNMEVNTYHMFSISKVHYSLSWRKHIFTYWALKSGPGTFRYIILIEVIEVIVYSRIQALVPTARYESHICCFVAGWA